MLFKRQSSALVPGTIYNGTIYSVSVLSENTEKERVLINVNSTAGLPGPASYATATPTGSLMLNQLMDSLNAESLEDLKGKEVRFAVKQGENYINTVIYPARNTAVAVEENEEPAV